eukprot:766894-Hanusia_phi.AAC.11
MVWECRADGCWYLVRDFSEHERGLFFKGSLIGGATLALNLRKLCCWTEELWMLLVREAAEEATTMTTTATATMMIMTLTTTIARDQEFDNEPSKSAEDRSRASRQQRTRTRITLYLTSGDHRLVDSSLDLVQGYSPPAPPGALCRQGVSLPHVSPRSRPPPPSPRLSPDRSTPDHLGPGAAGGPGRSELDGYSTSLQCRGRGLDESEEQQGARREQDKKKVRGRNSQTVLPLSLLLHTSTPRSWELTFDSISSMSDDISPKNEAAEPMASKSSRLSRAGRESIVFFIDIHKEEFPGVAWPTLNASNG